MSQASQTRPPIVWCVGGSDSSAHAGLQADLRTGQDLSCHVQTIVTCTTAQNSKRVDLVEPVSLSMFDGQWQTLLDDVLPDAIKVSLLPTPELVKACSEWLSRMKRQQPNIKVVFDPVMAASSEAGNRLQQDNAAENLLTIMLPHVDIITPNLMEFEALTGLLGQSNPHTLAQSMIELFGVNQLSWLLKGGHSDDASATDWWFKGEEIHGFSSPRLRVHNTRGTGCTLSTALASFLAHGYALEDAITLAKAYITGALKSGVQIGQGAGPLGRPGWPSKLDDFPEILSTSKMPLPMESFASAQQGFYGLYPVVDSVSWLALVLKQGVKVAQLRIKESNSSDLDDQIREAIQLGQEYQAQIYINDYWQKAIEFGAYGVHLGQEDLMTADLQAIQAAGLRLGISTHGYFEIARAKNFQPSYIALGHIFPTQTKDMPSQPQGVMRLQVYANLLKEAFPCVAIGGINQQGFASVAQTGVNCVAVVSAITQAEHPVEATNKLMQLFEEAQQEA
ncbi:thiamine phosphate synthase [Marinomonas sp. THO17]|uniref:thiamine phosphate synthase n=1 Tax=Marinomonas sp. THO17 TaxID=3149048 RepID=UPI00336C2431